MNSKLFIVIAAVAVSAIRAPTQTIDFEYIPGFGVPASMMAISNQFQSTLGVSFSLEGGGFPIIAEVGNGSFAFDPLNTPAPGQNVGRFFLAEGLNHFSTRTIRITYTDPVAAASGVLLDIDRDLERFLIEALDTNGTVVATNLITNASPNGGGGRAAFWSVHTASPVISTIRVQFLGTPQNNVGWGFDNFSPSLQLQPAQLLAAHIPDGTLVEVRGSPGGSYRVEHTSLLPAVEWLPLWSGTLTNPIVTILDPTVPNTPARFYRAVGLP